MSFWDQDLMKQLQSMQFGMYMRKSTTDKEDKQLRSIEGQKMDLDEIVERYRLNVKITRDERESAFKMGRPYFNELLEASRNDEINAWLTWHANRICRNYGDSGLFVQLMSEGKIQYVVTPHGIYENTPRDREYLMTEFTRATRDSDDKSVAIRRGNKVKLKAGYIPSGRLLQGYKHAANERKEMIQVKDEERFEMLQAAIGLILNGKNTPLEALDILNNQLGYRTPVTKREGGNPLSQSGFYSLLANPTYYGVLDRSEGFFHAEFPKMMTKEEFDKLQILLGRKGNRRKTKNDWAGKGKMLCGECGSAIVFEEKWQIVCSSCKTKFHKSHDRFNCPKCGLAIDQMIQPKLFHYTWAHCGKKKKTANGQKCTQKSITLADFETQVDSALSAIEIPEVFTQWAIKWLQKLNASEVAERTHQHTRIQELYNQDQKKLDNLLDMRVKGLIDDKEYEEKKVSLLTDKQLLKDRLEVSDQRANNWMELTERTFKFATHARRWFVTGTPEEKRSILRTLGSNITLMDGKVRIEEQKPFLLIRKALQTDVAPSQKLEHEEMVDLSQESEILKPLIPRLMPD